MLTIEEAARVEEKFLYLTLKRMPGTRGSSTRVAAFSPSVWLTRQEAGSVVTRLTLKESSAHPRTVRLWLSG